MSNQEYKILVKEHFLPDRRVILVLCDEDILGKIYEEGKKVLDLTSSYFKGELIDLNIIEKKTKRAYIVNVSGKNSIAYALEHNLIYESDIVYFDKIPHAESLTS